MVHVYTLHNLVGRQIRSDELARAIQVLPIPSPSSNYCLLARDGANILLGILAPIESPLVLIPDRPLRNSVGEGPPQEAKGSRGHGQSCERDLLRWFTLTNLEMLLEPPSSPNP